MQLDVNLFHKLDRIFKIHFHKYFTLLEIYQKNIVSQSSEIKSISNDRMLNFLFITFSLMYIVASFKFSAPKQYFTMLYKTIHVLHIECSSSKSTRYRAKTIN